MATMPDDIMTLAERLWQLTIEEVHPFSMMGDTQEVAECRMLAFGSVAGKPVT